MLVNYSTYCKSRTRRGNLCDLSCVTESWQLIMIENTHTSVTYIIHREGCSWAGFSVGPLKVTGWASEWQRQCTDLNVAR